MTSQQTLPIAFIGHGSPMNAIANNSYTQALRGLGQNWPTPEAILVISAHWQTRGIKIQASKNPNVIYDFYGFPEELYQVRYPAIGCVKLAQTVKDILFDEKADLTEEWGLDHGTWSVLLHIYPKANIPVVQLSLNRQLRLHEHFTVAQKLSSLRDQGVLLLGSGNVVHNLRAISWESSAKPHPWAIEFDELIKLSLESRDFEKLIEIEKTHPELLAQAHPSIEHYLPLIYFVGASRSQDSLNWIYEGTQNASISMRSMLYSSN